MAFYLVSAVPKHGRLDELGERLERAEFMSMRPFGATLSASLKNARIRKDGVAVWEEEDYCAPPLAQERAAKEQLCGFLSLCTEPVVVLDRRECP